MKRFSTSSFKVLLAALLLGLFAWPGASFAEPVSLKTCMEQSVKNWNMLKASEQDIKGKEAERDSMRGNFLPKLMIESNLMFWDQRRNALDIPGMDSILNDLGVVISDLAPKMDLLLSNDASRKAFANLMKAMGTLPEMMGPDSMLAHKKVTWTNTFTVAQPLMQLYKISAGYKAFDEQVISARYKKVEETHKLELDVARAYYGLIQAEKAVNTVETAIKQVEAIEKQVQAYLDQQLVEKNAMMKVTVQKTDLQKTLFVAQKGAQLARATLNMLMGRPLDTALEPVVEDGNVLENDPMLAGDLDGQKSKALSARPDVLSVRHLNKAADWGKHAAIGDFLPDLNAVFLVQWQKGLGEMAQPKHQYYGGLTLKWTFWEWGVSYYKYNAAESTKIKAQESLKALEASTRLDVEGRRLDLVEAGKVVGVAKSALVSARENLRIEQARFEAQETTTTDLLTAQTQAVQAENEETVSVMKYLQARLALKAAMGEDLVQH